MKKARNLTVEIDGTKLRDIFKARGLNLSDVSRDCGYDGSYFSHVCRCGKITKPASVLLQDRYKIYLGDYEIVKPESEVVQTELVPVMHTKDFEFSLTISDDTAKKLHQIIYSAVYEAMKMALNG